MAAKRKSKPAAKKPATPRRTKSVSAASAKRADGTLKKGHKYLRGGGVVKVASGRTVRRKR